MKLICLITKKNIYIRYRTFIGVDNENEIILKKLILVC